MSEKVKVIVRVRPMNQKELDEKSKPCTAVDEKLNSIQLTKPDDTQDSKTFTYDYAFGSQTAQQTIYEKSAFSLVESVLKGYNGTIFAYGQTGCGKTFTMIGLPQDDVLKGIIPRAFHHIINIINTSTQDRKYLVRCSYVEIYNEDVYDLLGKDVKAKLELKETPEKEVFIKDVAINVVKSVADMENYMNLGTKNKAVGPTAMNNQSSRSHCIFTLYIECQTTDALGNEHITAGKLNLVDLAGSERQSKTHASGQRLIEANKINLSLSALGNVISALVDGRAQHIPYRDSKLTRLLQDSLGGNTKTIMIAAVSPASSNYDESLSTLRYASRAKMIKNQPKVNEDPKDAQLRAFAEEIKKLKELMQNQQFQQSVPTKNNEQVNIDKIKEEVAAQEREKHENELKERVQKEKEERERLEALIKEKEQELVEGGKANLAEKEKFKSLQEKIEQQKKQHEILIQENLKKEEEKLKMEKGYKDLTEEVQDLNKLVKFLRKKYQESLKEIKDLEEEFQKEKEDLLDTIRVQEKEVKLFNGIVQMLLSNDELEKIKAQCEWNENRNNYAIPPFFLKNKTVKFPSINSAQAIDQAMEQIHQEKESREIYFSDQEGERRSSSVKQKQKQKQRQNSPVRFSEMNHVFNQNLDSMGYGRYEKKQTKVQLDPLTNEEFNRVNFKSQKIASEKPPIPGNSKNQKNVKLEKIS